MLRTPQPPPPKTVLTALVNEIDVIPNRFVLVLDDYHVIETQFATAVAPGHRHP
jgi:LuxR family maltose regulon positive regulatory protein